MGYATISYETSGEVALVTLQRPNALNAITAEMIDELLDALHEVQVSDGLRSLLLTGAGKAFCAGQDVQVLAAGSRDEIERLVMERYPELILGLQRLEKPVVAAINGVAVGSGFSLALASDIRIAAEGVSMGPGFARIGAGPDSGCIYFLPRIVGLAKAAELIFTGAIVGAPEAQAMGLVNRVVAADHLLPESLSLAQQLARGPTRAIAQAKRLLQETASAGLEQALTAEAQGQTEVLKTEDFRRGVSAFLEKRQPEFVGR